MNNKEILEKEWWQLSHNARKEKINYDRVMFCMESARSDERDRMKAEQKPTSGMTEAEFGKAKAGASIETIFGKEARLVCHDLEGGNGNVVVVYTDASNIRRSQVMYESDFKRNFRLKITKREGWILLNQRLNSIPHSIVYKSEKEALDYSYNGEGVTSLKPCKITWEE